MSREPKEGEHFLLSFPSKYLRGVDLRPAEGEEVEVSVTISRVEVGAEVSKNEGGKEVIEERILVHFQGKDKALILNKTVAKQIQRALGTAAMDKWKGKTLRLYTHWGKWFGVYQPGIRVRVK
jgi:hypothetical protein